MRAAALASLLAACASRPEAQAWNQACDALDRVSQALAQQNGSAASEALREAESQAARAAALNADEFYAVLNRDVADLRRQAAATDSVSIPVLFAVMEDDCKRSNLPK